MLQPDLEIANQIYKIVTYQLSCVRQHQKALCKEWLWDGPTWGGDYMDDDWRFGRLDTARLASPLPGISRPYDRTAGYEELGGLQIR